MTGYGLFPLLCVLALGVCGTSAARGQAVHVPQFEPEPGWDQPYRWRGSYAGAHVGYGFGMSSNQWAADRAGPWMPDGDIHYRSLLGGVHAGYQVQFDNFVIGAEADLSMTRLQGDDSQFAGAANQIEINTVGTLRGRFGLAFDNVMVFATGGLAAAQLTKRDLTNLSAASPHFGAGWTVGAGLEMAISTSLRARLEYQHIQLGRIDTGIVVGGGGYVHRADNPAINIVRAGLSYAF